jgi:Flp pilus assembly protein TadD
MGRKTKKTQSFSDRLAPHFGAENNRQMAKSLCSSNPRKDAYIPAVISCLLLLSVVLVFGQTVKHDFVNYDDGKYVFENRQVMKGLTAEGVAWAFTTNQASNWHPVTWLSHMLDAQLYGIKAGGHHLTNIMLHALVTILLFFLLWRMTGLIWRSAFVAAVFAIHPLRAESVAWISERKDILSGLFLMLTLLTYIDYARRPFSAGRYFLVIVLFVLGLMSKPMLVTLPFVMLLLDYWPLGRIKSATGGLTPSLRRVLVEKIPLILLTAASCMATYIAQTKALFYAVHVPITTRIANAFVSYVSYIGKFFFPIGLTPFYPHPGTGIPPLLFVLSFLAVAGISIAAISWHRKYPYLFVGWFWYIGMLVPVIGLLQVGRQSMADRYTYLPQIGLCLSITWGVVEIFCTKGYRRWMIGGTATLVLLVLMGTAFRQTSYWRDGLTLWTHAIACTGHDPIVDYNYRDAVKRSGRVNTDIAYYQKVLKEKPNAAGDAHYNLGVLLAESGQIDAAIEHYQKALKIRPDDTDALNNLANSFAAQGKIDAAVDYYRKALKIKPANAEVHNNLGVALDKLGQKGQAADHYLQALRIKPEYAEAHNNLALILAQRGEADAAIDHYKRALEIKPDYAEAHNNLGNLLTGRGEMDAAALHYRKAMELNPYP